MGWRQPWQNENYRKRMMIDVKLSQFGRIGVLYGGVSAERDVSLKSGDAVFTACENLGLDVIGIDLTEQAVQQLHSANIDTAFIALHGGVGEDGRLQALLDFMNIAYTGSDAQASMLAMNKLISKQIWFATGLPTANFEVLSQAMDAPKVLEKLGGKVMVKPAHEGSSIGMSIAESPEDLTKAYNNAAQYDACVFAEKLLPGEEYTVSIVAGEVLPPIKLAASGEFYDYEAKYLSNDTQYICPCGLSVGEEAELKSLSAKAFDSLGCRGWGRVDVIRDEDGSFKLLEVNTAPGMTKHSLVPMAANAAGYSFDELIKRILLSVNTKR